MGSLEKHSWGQEKPSKCQKISANSPRRAQKHASSQEWTQQVKDAAAALEETGNSLDTEDIAYKLLSSLPEP